MKLFIIHGWTYDLKRWTKLCSLLSKSGIDPIQLKVPGLTEPSDKTWTIDEYVEWLHEQLSKETSPVLMGHSNGGRIALAYCQKYPSHFRQLFLIDSAGVPHEGFKQNTKVKILKAGAKTIKVLGAVPGVKKILYRAIGAQDYQNAPPNMKVTMRNMLAADKNLDLGQIKIPAVLIWGKDDTQTPLADGKKMHERIKGSSLHIIKDARHSPFATNPDEVLKIILQEMTL